MPTIVCLIEKKTDTSYFYSMSEEEQADKDIKADLNVDLTIVLFNFPARISKIITSPQCAKLYKSPSTIFIPPPEFI